MATTAARLALVLVVSVALAAAGCATAPPAPTAAPAPEPPRVAAPSLPAPAPAAPAPAPEPLPERFESDDFIVVFAREGDTASTLAARVLGDESRAWMIEDYNGRAAFSRGQQVVVPKGDWNPSGVDANGYQIVPILVYHNLGPQSKGRLVLGARAFEQQMRHLKAEGYRVISLRDFVDFMEQGRQIPRRSVIVTFDDGYRAFKDIAYPILKELGFTATLFVYTDYVGAGRNALTWAELGQFAKEGFEIQAHTKTHGDLRRESGEPDAQYNRRMKAELSDPQALFRRHLGRPADILAFPYGRWDEDLLKKVTEYGYIAAFTVRRQGNPSFVYPLRGHRAQVYSEMSLEDFARNLAVYQEEDLR
jgi:peptidoglycan/xylan/chitin deacetylase (PgdA/CDA1 family)